MIINFVTTADICRISLGIIILFTILVIVYLTKGEIMDDQEFISLYEDKDIIVKDIGKMLNISSYKVRVKARKLGLSDRGKFKKLPPIEAILFLYKKKGLTLDEIGRKYGSHAAAVSNLLRRHDRLKGNRKMVDFKIRGGYAWVRNNVVGRLGVHHRGFISMYRLNMERHLGRMLVKGETVHHIDLNKRNDRISNLKLCTESEHRKMHYQLERLAGELVRKNVIYFKDGTYYIDKRKLA